MPGREPENGKSLRHLKDLLVRLGMTYLVSRVAKRYIAESYQGGFQPTTPCVHCESTAQLAFTKKGINPENLESTHTGEGIWPHDSCAFAVYICPSCGEATAKWDQA